MITRQTASGTLTVNATGGATINGGASFTMPTTAYTAITIVCDGLCGLHIDWQVLDNRNSK